MGWRLASRAICPVIAPKAPNSKLRNLNPFIDSDGLLRVGGRLSNSDLPYVNKHPAILPGNHNLTVQIIVHFHRKNLHTGASSLLHYVREKFWPLNGRSLCRKVVHECLICFKSRPLVTSQLMGNLPRDRVVPAYPFNCSGVDFCGPFMIRYKNQRKGILHKIYICVFVCFVSKAIHIEIVSDLTSDAFIATLKRFFSRRGKCAKLYSDNGKTFVGANKELKRFLKLIEDSDDNLAGFLSAEGIDWKFIPPRAPSFGGLWEASTARGGRVRSTTPAEDRYIVLSAKRNRRTTAQQVANQFLAASGKQISRKTVARRLRGGGLYARRPVVCVPLTRQHRTARLQWCREHHNWTEQDWACVLFSDESRFSLSSDCRRQLIWRESGIAYRPENIQEKDRYPTCSIMVWAGIMINGRTRLHVVANGTMTGQRYIDEVLLPHVRLFRGAVGDKFVFMDDNATCHRTLAVKDCLDSEGIQRLVWPACSPDLNPIENVWDTLGRQVSGRNYPPTNKNTLIRALTEEWDKLPQQLLDNVVQSMVRRVECCITLHGGHIPY
ncbi:transposable element Tcb2 transposase [Trichonephila clavipes]|nr:transposable element Tcb2 transposase [Trichonephila clavipes]